MAVEQLFNSVQNFELALAPSHPTEDIPGSYGLTTHIEDMRLCLANTHRDVSYHTIWNIIPCCNQVLVGWMSLACLAGREAYPLGQESLLVRALTYSFRSRSMRLTSSQILVFSTKVLKTLSCSGATCIIRSDLRLNSNQAHLSFSSTTIPEA